MAPGMSFTMAPTANMDVQLIDFLDLERYLEMSLPLPATGKERRALIQRVKDTVYELRSDKSIRRDKDRLKTYFVSSYCFLNFATPEVRVLAELADTREDFLKTMARKPFYMIENGRPTALNLYHKERESDGESDEVHIEYPSDLTTEKVSDLPEDTIETTDVKSSRVLERRVITSAREIISKALAKSNANSLEVQLRLLAAGVINPRIFGINLAQYNLPNAREIYREMAERNGDFEIPLPAIAVDD